MTHSNEILNEYQEAAKLVNDMNIFKLANPFLFKQKTPLFKAFVAMDANRLLRAHEKGIQLLPLKRIPVLKALLTKTRIAVSKELKNAGVVGRVDFTEEALALHYGAAIEFDIYHNANAMLDPEKHIHKVDHSRAVSFESSSVKDKDIVIYPIHNTNDAIVYRESTGISTKEHKLIVLHHVYHSTFHTGMDRMFYDFGIRSDIYTMVKTLHTLFGNNPEDLVRKMLVILEPGVNRSEVAHQENLESLKQVLAYLVEPEKLEQAFEAYYMTGSYKILTQHLNGYAQYIDLIEIPDHNFEMPTL